ncbi:MAG: DUF2333 family protein [Desulfobacteraceae bacterium]|nr:DUF2333 family protein [Desulfobacteraceae bacterium]
MKSTRQEKDKPKRGLTILIVIFAFVLFVVIVMAVNARKPGRIVMGPLDTSVKGAAFININEILVEEMYENWLPNDIYWPTVLLDNMPNFQIGVLEVVRYNVRVLRDNLTRMRTTDKLDPYAEGAFTALSNDPYKWWFPSAESKWELAAENLAAFQKALLEGKSHFYPRADNLVELLNQYASLMGGVNTRLVNAPRDMDVVLTFDEETGKGPKGSKMVKINIPWYGIDDNFYYAQGVAYALYESFKAIRIDFMSVLKDKNSVRLVDKILEDLYRCHFEPLVVFNGDPGSIFANHSLNLSGIFNDARQKVYSLTVALMRG